MRWIVSRRSILCAWVFEGSRSDSIKVLAGLGARTCCPVLPDVKNMFELILPRCSIKIMLVAQIWLKFVGESNSSHNLMIVQRT